jgi:hypothetical protein
MWLQAREQELSERSDTRRGERAPERAVEDDPRQAHAIGGDDEFSSARAAVVAAEQTAATAAEEALPAVLTQSGNSETGLFGGITGAASRVGHSGDNLFGDSFDS